jgi:hypothetical protein
VILPLGWNSPRRAFSGPQITQIAQMTQVTRMKDRQNGSQRREYHGDES